jgi:pimeloyl-ACP methyl ester carboxylesterase
MVSVSAPAQYAGMDAVRTGPRLRVPALLLAAEGDTRFADDARSLSAATSAAQLELLPGAQHGTALVAASPKARGLIEAFLRSH